ncbi:MAG: hypothetical protein ACE5JC_03555 [Candidatus Zixiibacteriota bacterium]
MKCYFHGSGSKDSSEQESGLVSFAIPDVGVLFRSTWRGNLYQCQYVSLLFLLKFIEVNPDVFSQVELQLYGDCPLIIQQINGQAYTPKSLEAYRDLSRLYVKKLHFSLRWIPEQQNRATSKGVDMPPNPSLKGLNFEELSTLSGQLGLSGRLRARGDS